MRICVESLGVNSSLCSGSLVASCLTLAGSQLYGASLLMSGDVLYLSRALSNACLPGDTAFWSRTTPAGRVSCITHP